MYFDAILIQKRKTNCTNSKAIICAAYTGGGIAESTVRHCAVRRNLDLDDRELSNRHTVVGYGQI